MTSIDRDQLGAARDALGMEKDAGIISGLKRLGRNALLLGGGGLGLYHAGKHMGKKQKPKALQPEQEGAFKPEERQQFARFGMDPDRLKFMQTLSNLRQGMNLEKKLFEQALSGSLPSRVLGGGESDDEADLESYA